MVSCIQQIFPDALLVTSTVPESCQRSLSQRSLLFMFYSSDHVAIPVQSKQSFALVPLVQRSLQMNITHCITFTTIVSKKKS